MGKLIPLLDIERTSFILYIYMLTDYLIKPRDSCGAYYIMIHDNPTKKY